MFTCTLTSKNIENLISFFVFHLQMNLTTISSTKNNKLTMKTTEFYFQKMT